MIYAIGDLQGCLQPLKNLLKKIAFNPDHDQLWLAGDLINRGPESLETLRFCYERRDNIVAVLGNHDLHLLAVAASQHTDQPLKTKKKDTLDGILNAPDKETLLTWLRHNPLLHHDTTHNAAICHAGIAPCWDLEQAATFAREVETVLAQDDPKQRDAYFKAMYGNEPNYWSDDLAGTDRLRTITNFFTRMRLCHADGSLDFSYKGKRDAIPESLTPWFEYPNRKTIPGRLLFGHWAALLGDTRSDTVIGLDYGCVWGNQLAAYCVDDQTLHTESG